MNNVHHEFELLIGEDKPNHQAADQHWITLWHSLCSDEESIYWLKDIAPGWQGE